jgi:hypothetical protein
MPGGLSLSGCSHPHTAPAPWASCAAPVPAAGPRCAPPAGSALRGRQSDRAATAAPSGDQPAGWSSIPMERGEAMGKPGRSSGPAPQRGINRQTRSGFPAPSPPSQRERSNGLHHQSERPWQKQGPAGPPPGAAVPPHSTDTVPTPAACSLRATERAVSRGIRRGFCTGRPRRPMWTVTRGSAKALLLLG